MYVETASTTHRTPLEAPTPSLTRTPTSAPCTEVCPQFHEAIELIGKRWTGAIVCALTEGPMRFGELGKAVPGLSDRLLSQRLRELEDEGLVEREVEAGTPVRVTYSLTATGEDLGPAIRELKAWAKRWKSAG
jgi:DNA-binding HxlR family transcriptional regulator